MRYTAIGENVEFAMRLKQLNLLYGTRILVTGAARQDVEERFWWRRVDVLSVEDLEMEIELFELIDERSMPLSADTGEFVKRYEAGLSLVRAGEDKGLALFEDLREARPEDRSVGIMVQRCLARNASVCPVENPFSLLMR
jgi:adenylate cyclase